MSNGVKPLIIISCSKARQRVTLAAIGLVVCLVLFAGTGAELQRRLISNVAALLALKSDVYLTGKLPNPSLARAQADQYASLTEDCADCSRWLWRLDFWGGATDRAAQVYRRYITPQKQIHNWDTHWLLREGQTLLDLGQYDIAEEAFMFVAHMGADPAAGYYGAGRVRKQMGDRVHAREFYRAGIEAGTTRMAEGYFLLGYSHFQEGNIQEALSAWLVALDVAAKYGGLPGPMLKIALVHLGQIYQNRGELDEAWKYFIDAIALDPENEWGPEWAICWAYLGKGEVLLHEGDMAGARTTYEAGVPRCLGPKEAAEVRIRLAQIYQQTGDYVLAEQALRQALALDPLTADLLVRIGDGFVQLGLRQSAITAYWRALESDPTNPVAIQRLSSPSE